MAPESLVSQMFPPPSAAAITDPFSDIATLRHSLLSEPAVHVSPESLESQMLPNSSTAASALPPEDDAISRQYVLEADVISQLRLESVDRQMRPGDSTAAHLVPSEDDAMLIQRPKTGTSVNTGGPHQCPPHSSVQRVSLVVQYEPAGA